MLPATVLQPAAQLSLDRPPTPVKLVLEVAERVELALSGDDFFDPVSAERADQLVLEVCGADVRRVAEDTPEPSFLVGVAQADDVLTVVLRRCPANRLRTADRDDLDPGQIEAEPLGYSFQGDSVGNALNEDHSHAMTLAASVSASSVLRVSPVARRSSRSPRTTAGAALVAAAGAAFAVLAAAEVATLRA